MSEKIPNYFLVILIVLVFGMFILGFYVWSISKDITLIENSIVSLNSSVISSDRVIFSDVVDKISESVVGVQNSNGFGAGFSIRDDGYILTTSHAVDNYTSVDVHLRNGTYLNASVYKKDINKSDLAILKVNSNLTSVKLIDDKGTVQIGNRIGFLGFPLEITTLNLNTGIISSDSVLNEPNKVEISSFVERGNSGGPLFLSRTGEVIGLIAAKNNFPVEEIEFDDNQVPKENLILLNYIEKTYNAFKNHIKKNAQTGIGEAILIDKNILDELPKSD